MLPCVLVIHCYVTKYPEAWWNSWPHSAISQKSKSILAGWLWLRVYRRVSPKVAVIWGLIRAARSASKCSCMAVGSRPQLLTMWVSHRAALNRAVGFRHGQWAGIQRPKCKPLSFIASSQRYHITSSAIAMLVHRGRKPLKDVTIRSLGPIPGSVCHHLPSGLNEFYHQTCKITHPLPRLL